MKNLSPIEHPLKFSFAWYMKNYEENSQVLFKLLKLYRLNITQVSCTSYGYFKFTIHDNAFSI